MADPAMPLDTTEDTTTGTTTTDTSTSTNPTTTQAAAMPTNFGDATTFSQAADLADAQPNTNFQTYNSADTSAKLEDTKTATEYKTAASSVADQMSKLLNPDSELNRAVKASTREQSAALGMGSSSMALEAGQAALLKQAESIASKDAELNSKFELQQQQADYAKQQTLAEAQVAGDLNAQKATIQEQTDKVKRSWDATLAGLNADQQTEITNLTKSWDEQITKYQLQVQERMKNAELDANAEVMLMNQSNEMMNNYQVTVQQLMSNTEFMNSLGNSKDKMANIFNAMFGTVSSALQFSANAVGVGSTMSPYIQQLISQNSWTNVDAGA